jgi:chromate transporter
MNEPQSKRLSEVALLFLKLGLTAFGGPAAHIAMMYDETVKRRGWLSDQEFADLLGATNLIPGPNSTEMAIHIGFRRGGWRGLIVGGLFFIVPAMMIVLALAWGYVAFGSLPEVAGLLYGVKPVVLAIIVLAFWDLGQKVIKGPLTAIVGLSVILFSFVGVHELVLLLVGGLVVMFGINVRRPKWGSWGAFLAPIGAAISPQVAAPFSPALLFFTFLKIGSVLYGSGYVLLAFLRADFVIRYGWITDRQLMDAIAVGQITPGPVFTTATFIGFLLGGISGGVVATLGIFLPSFLFVAISNRFIPRLRRSAWLSGLLDGVNVASIGLMVAVTWELGRDAWVGLSALLITLVSLVLLIRFRINSTWLILGGAITGWLVWIRPIQ